MKNRSTLDISEAALKVKNKSIRKKTKKRKNGKSESGSEGSGGESCDEHGQQVEFICVQVGCQKVLCGRCILQHKTHIEHIKFIPEVIEHFEKNKDSKLSELLGLLSHQKGQSSSDQSLHSQLAALNSANHQKILEQLEETEQQLVQVVRQKVEVLREQCGRQNQENTRLLGRIEELQGVAGKIETARNYAAIENMLANSSSSFHQWLFQNDQLVHAQVKEAIAQNLSLVSSEHSLESSYQNAPKLLHWFEWGKNRLIIYDIVANKTEEVQFEADFKVPAFSRSVMLKDGRIFLMGGEQPEYYSRKEVYCYSPETKQCTKKQNMLIKKFDFSICAIQNSIYVLCGKDQQSTVSDSCERYDCTTDKWQSVSKTHVNRYAATAVGFQNKAIFLFGGRGDQNHEMISLIERYDIATDQWSQVHIKANEHLWQPVEVCAGIQTSPNQILIFGGSEAQLQDTCTTLTFHVDENTFTRKEDLLKSHIFVQQPFLYGQYVYGVGNEYYIKQRNLHRYHIASDTWDLLF